MDMNEFRSELSDDPSGPAYGKRAVKRRKKCPCLAQTHRFEFNAAPGIGRNGMAMAFQERRMHVKNRRLAGMAAVMIM